MLFTNELDDCFRGEKGSGIDGEVEEKFDHEFAYT